VLTGSIPKEAWAKPVGSGTLFLAVCRPARAGPAKEHADTIGNCDDARIDPLDDS
jgi:hypothetical protein